MQPYPPGFEPFLQSVIDAPEDDAPRLIFADWLDEHGLTDRAAFIRFQIEFARATVTNPYPGNPLVDNHRFRPFLKRWMNHLPSRPDMDGMLSEYSFDRGFVDSFTGTAEEFIQHAERILEFEPLHRLCLRDVILERIALELARMPQLSRIHELSCAGGGYSDTIIQQLLNSPNWQSLSRLDVSKCGLGPETIRFICDRYNHLQHFHIHSNPFSGTQSIRYLTDIDWPNLQSLDVSSNFLDREPLRLIATANRFPRLKRFYLQSCGLDDEVSEHFAISECFPQLELLDASFNPIRDEGVAHLTIANRFSKLKRLILHGTGVGDHGISLIANSDRYPELTELDIVNNRVEQSGMSDAGFISLLDSPLAMRLSYLNLSCHRIGAEGWRAFLKNKQIKLNAFYCRSIDLGDDWTSRIMSAPALEKLYFLYLSSCNLGKKSIAKLASLPEVANLRELDLSGNPLVEKDYLKLISSPYLSRNLILTLSDIAMKPKTKAALVERFPFVELF